MLKQLLRNSHGSVFAIVSVAAMSIVGAVGVAVDVGRSQMVQAKLQSAVDSAGLAAGATLNSADLDAVATKYVQLNFTQGILGSELGEVDTTLTADKKILTVTASAEIPTTIMQVFGRDSVTVNAATEVTRSNKGLELALVLDTTGSMEGSKLTALKNASNDLVDILFGDDATQENLWVGVVPFSQAVNVGSTRTDWLNEEHYDGLNWGSTGWAGCLDARYDTDRDVTDDPPYDLADPDEAVPAIPYERFKAYYWSDHDSYNNWAGTSSDTDTTTLCYKKKKCKCSNYGPCTTTTDDNVTTTIYCNGSDSNRSCYKDVTTVTPTYNISSTKGPNKYCPSVITPLTNVKATVEAGIAALVARGNTHVNTGAVWGWRLISPRWRGYWGGDMNTNNLPLNYNAPLMSKAVVIMTDGQNTMSGSVRSAYGYLPEGNLDTTDSSDAVEELDDRLETVCNALKAQGVIVYTILFQEDEDSVVTLMRECATNPDYFFNSPSEEALQSAFNTIGDSLANLRISK